MEIQDLMPDLSHCLSQQDLRFLTNVADLWGLKLSAKNANALISRLKEAMLSEPLAREYIAALPADARSALAALKQHGGSMAWSVFTLSNGDLRGMGPAKREREKPYLFPVSTTERLWYRALIGREFVRNGEDLLEVAYLPDEFLALLPEDEAQAAPPLQQGFEALDPSGLSGVEKHHDQVLDDACTLLAWLRRSEPISWLDKDEGANPYWHSLSQLLQDLRLVDTNLDAPTLEARPFLEMERAAALRWLVEAWSASRAFNELRLVPEYSCQGSWRNDPLAPRRALLKLVGALPACAWYRLEDLTAFIYATDPEFLRKGGDFHSWIIQGRVPGEGLLRGSESWQQVEGSYIRFVVAGLMFWLGLVEVAHLADETGQLAFRKSESFDGLMGQEELPNLPAEDVPAILSSDGLLQMTNLTARIGRYQLSRFCEWVEITPRRYVYRLSPGSLKAASAQGLTSKHLLSLLRKFTHANPAPALVKAIQRWDAHGREAWMEEVCVLRLGSADILQALRDSPVSALLGEALGPTAVLVKPGGAEKVRSALTRLGYLADIDWKTG